VIVDAGANIGLAAIFYANRYPSARIIAIEPERSNYEVLARNAACYPNIVPIRAALWKENKEINIHNPGKAHTTFQIESQHARSANARWGAAPGITLDKLMADEGIDYIDLLKVDIEGAEKAVFENSAAWTSRVGVIAIELHDWIQPGATQAVRQATRDFEIEWTQGETTYLARAGDIGGALAPIRPATQPSNSAPHRVPRKSRLKIVAYGDWLSS
jgi:FkbM family methyltransferase